MDRDTRERERTTRQSGERSERSLSLSDEGKMTFSNAMLIALVLVAALISFTGVTLSFQSIRDFTALTAMLYVITTMSYRNRYNNGKLRGKNDKEYRDALEDYQNAIEGIPASITDERIASYCEQYKERELKEYRKDILMGFHVKYDEYERQYLSLNFWQILFLRKPWSFRVAVWRCNRAKPMKLDQNMLMSESGNARRKRAIGISGTQRERRDKAWNSISKAIVSMMGGAVAVSIVLDFSMETLAQWAIRILPVIGAIISGDSDGYDNIAVTECNRKREQTKIINRMVAELSKSSSVETPDVCENAGGTAQ